MSENLLDRHVRLTEPALGKTIDLLIELAGGSPSAHADWYRDLLRAASRLISEDASRWDTKIATYTLTEMVRAFGWLKRYERRRKASVFGSARTQPDDPDYALAQEVGRRLVDEGFMVITGAGDGAMRAANEGAGVDDSLGFNIQLPFEQSANVVLADQPGLMEFRFFFIRKLFFVKESDAVIALPGGFGTGDELFEVLTLIQTGKTPIVPVVLVDTPGSGYWEAWREFVEGRLQSGGYISPADSSFYQIVHSAEDALDVICGFYKNYHSARWVNDHLHLRLKQPLAPEAVATLNEEFVDICRSGGFEMTVAASEEADEPELAQMPRLACHFDNHQFGRLRELIDRVNELSPTIQT